MVPSQDSSGGGVSKPTPGGGVVEVNPPVNCETHSISRLHRSCVRRVPRECAIEASKKWSRRPREFITLFLRRSIGPRISSEHNCCAILISPIFDTVGVEVRAQNVPSEANIHKPAAPGGAEHADTWQLWRPVSLHPRQLQTTNLWPRILLPIVCVRKSGKVTWSPQDEHDTFAPGPHLHAESCLAVKIRTEGV